MKTLTTTMISLLLVVFAVAAPASAERASVLLQEGLYAEEIEGDLDGAIKIYQKVITNAAELEQAAAQAMYRIGICYAKKGDKAKAAEYFGKLITEHPGQEVLAAKAQEQLTKLGIGQPDSAGPIGLYEKLPPEVIQFVGNKYGSICAEAGAKKLYSNSHVYYITSDFMLLKGGMGYYHNTSDKALFNKIRLCGTSEPKQTHYDIAGRKMNTEIVRDKVRSGFYHIYWTPHQPVPAGEMFYFGWCIDKAEQLSPVSAQNPALDTAQYELTMQNEFGNRVVETFFLVVPAGTQIVSKTEDCTSKETISGFDVYSFSKEVPEDTNHQVDVVLAGPVPAEPKPRLYERLPNDVVTHIAGKYGSISIEAVAKNLYSNSHIYFVTSDWVLFKAGMNHYRNMSGRPQAGRIYLSGTSYPNQTLYDIAGRQMNVEIVQDNVRSGYYHIYWTPSEPLPPGQMFYYGWCIDDLKQLNPAAGTGHYALEMQNKFGQRVVETFFLVVPAGTEIIDKSEDYTAKDTVGDFDVYYWSKEVPQNTNNVANVTLAGPVLSAAQEVTLPIILHSRADIDLDIEPEKYVAFDFDRGM
ncbi:MAG: tetratricopeptide repeat protein, partial [Sedimentisphaerales bacterium]|nr:tetratricopeptide repeat protein [Sedimentisphaerales bacterium]